MQTVDEKLETIHVYVVREEVPKPSLLPIFLSAFMLFLLLILCVFSSYQQPEIRTTLRVPAVLLPIQNFGITEAIIPTGRHIVGATTAHGMLTVTNGSIISQTLPKGMIIGNVILDYSVFVPAGNANGYGYATVSAHAITSGKNGNIPAYAINYVEGSSIYIRNLTSFHGGKDAYTIPLQLPKDRQIALDHARTVLSQSVQSKAILAFPCTENHFINADKLVIIWQCQFVTYSVPTYMHVTRVRVSGKNLLVDVVYQRRILREGQK